MNVEVIVKCLGLAPHPEGGWYRETFRDSAGTDGRAHSTAIYYLLQAGEVSRWHRIDAAEVWHWYAGDALELRISQDGATNRIVLGPDFACGQQPQAVVPAHHWQSARPLGAYTLAGCTVAPGFAFSAFEIAPNGWAPD
jgi:predicted cupin superfamily sugar epimerase